MRPGTCASSRASVRRRAVAVMGPGAKGSVLINMTSGPRIALSTERKERAMNGVNHCGAYLRHLQAEHHRLNSAVFKIRHHLAEFWENGEAEAARDSLIDELENLLQQLQLHFQEEEEETGVLAEAVARCRSVRPNVESLMDEHPQLAEALEEVIVGLKGRTIDKSECRLLFEAFVRKLKAHECVEDALLQFAMGAKRRNMTSKATTDDV
jgi:hypothetical protein